MKLEDLLTRLGDTDVPPPPAELEDGVHERVNRVLLANHIFDLVVRGFPYAAYHLASAVFGLICLTVRGQFPPDRREPDGFNETNPS